MAMIQVWGWILLSEQWDMSRVGSEEGGYSAGISRVRLPDVPGSAPKVLQGHNVAQSAIYVEMALGFTVYHINAHANALCVPPDIYTLLVSLLSTPNAQPHRQMHFLTQPNAQSPLSALQPSARPSDRQTA